MKTFLSVGEIYTEKELEELGAEAVKGSYPSLPVYRFNGQTYAFLKDAETGKLKVYFQYCSSYAAKRFH